MTSRTRDVRSPRRRPADEIPQDVSALEGWRRARQVIDPVNVEAADSPGDDQPGPGPARDLQGGSPAWRTAVPGGDQPGAARLPPQPRGFRAGAGRSGRVDRARRRGSEAQAAQHPLTATARRRALPPVVLGGLQVPVLDEVATTLSWRTFSTTRTRCPSRFTSYRGREATSTAPQADRRPRRASWGGR